MLHFLFAQAVQAAPANWYEEPWFMIVSVLAILIVPYFIGESIGRSLRMPDYGWKIGLILIALVAGLVIDVVRWPPRLGIDLKGGVKLVYQLDQSKLRSVNIEQLVKRISEAAKTADFGSKKAEVRPRPDGQLEVKLPSDDPAKVQQIRDAIAKADPDLQKTIGVNVAFVSMSTSEGATTLVYQAEHSADAVDMGKLINAVVKRVNPGGQREVAIRKVGTDQIEVAIPDVDKAEVEQIKEKIATAGALEFRIVADRRLPEHEEAIKAAEQDINNPSNEVSNGEKIVAQWVDLGKDEESMPSWLTRKINGKTQVLVMRDDYDVTGGFLTNASMGYGEKGIEVRFSFNTEGARRFGELTGSNLPDPGNNIGHQLAIILDNTLMSAANIESRITDSGRITGHFTEERVNTIVDVLNAGALPAALQKEPISQDTISAELGQDTIRNSALSMIVSTVAVLVFMLFYYRFAGIVANAAVLFNLMLVLALMIVFKAAFTLAGLAGLVLSVGMAVDSNVLIYERMREEKERGAALRMVIRNGFGRAMATIIDTHSTTIITGVILYIIGTEQLRGFAVTLVMGLVVNLFTAVFCARVVFDIAERQRWLKELKMLKLFGETKIDFVSIMKPAIAVSILISVAGLVALWQRGRTILDVDFTGGSEVQIALNTDKAMDVSEVRKIVEQPSVAESLPDVTVNAVTSSSVPVNTQFVIRTSNEDLKAVEAELAKIFGDRLRHYRQAKPAKVERIEAKAPSSGTSGVKPPTVEADTTRSASPAVTPTTPPAAVPGKEPPKTGPPPAEAPKEAPAAKKEKAESPTSDGSKKEPPNADAKPVPPPQPPKGASLLRFDRMLLTTAFPEFLLADDKPAEAPATDKRPAEAPPTVPPLPDKSDQTKEANSKPADSAASGAKPADAKADATKPAEAKLPSTTSSNTSTTGTRTDPAKSPADAGTANSNTQSPPREVPPGTELRDFLNRGQPLTVEDSFAGGSVTTLQFPDPIKHDALQALLEQSLPRKGVRFELSNSQHTPGDSHAYSEWNVRLSVPPDQAAPILESLNAKLASAPVFLSDSKIGSRVASSTQWTAVKALIASIIMIVVYIWIRFQNVIYGIGAVVALIHDVLVTMAGVALSYYVAGFLGFLLVDPFKISLNVVAALLTIVGYSISDTIVIFDRIREVRGKSPDLTEEMINKSVNQTLSRTVLTVFTVLLVTVILYIAGGQAIHAFAFTMLIGLISGTYSSVYIAAPCLLWLKLPSGQNGK
jgi:SecD/SecF fusion protein